MHLLHGNVKAAQFSLLWSKWTNRTTNCEGYKFACNFVKKPCLIWGNQGSVLSLCLHWVTLSLTLTFSIILYNSPNPNLNPNDYFYIFLAISRKIVCLILMTISDSLPTITNEPIISTMLADRWLSLESVHVVFQCAKSKNNWPTIS